MWFNFGWFMASKWWQASTMNTGPWNLRRHGISKSPEETAKQYLQKSDRNGFRIQLFESNSKGNVATQTFNKNDFLLQYDRELITANGHWREDDNSSQLCFRYFFNFKGVPMCIDDTKEPVSRLVNQGDARELNCRIKMLDVDGPVLAVFDLKDI